jgi:hypothetical protein
MLSYGFVDRRMNGSDRRRQRGGAGCEAQQTDVSIIVGAERNLVRDALALGKQLK